MDKTMNRHVLVLPVDFDDYAWEIEAKGWFNDAVVMYEGEKYRITFYDVARLSQDIEEALSAHAAFVEKNIVILNSVTREAMEHAIEFIAASDCFTRLKPEENSRNNRGCITS
jgi:hypothetical protein